MTGHFIDLGLGIIETVVLFDPHLRHLNILVGFEAGMALDLDRVQPHGANQETSDRGGRQPGFRGDLWAWLPARRM